MEFEWDNRKNISNIERHKIDFNDAWEVFESPMIERLDTRRDYGEERWIGLGLLDGAVVVIVYTIRGDRIRIISLRRANYDERKIYEEEIS